MILHEPFALTVLNTAAGAILANINSEFAIPLVKFVTALHVAGSKTQIPYNGLQCPKCSHPQSLSGVLSDPLLFILHTQQTLSFGISSHILTLRSLHQLFLPAGTSLNI